ncbi:MAG: hypothetical protein KJ893_00925 [Candidatus Omnitrophica bacterium]|nr:hypothetical protein [Candidatus Omnitrophota bacterium]MCG2702793.1 hypothetical protein [Candidatus Omnitrophota bacterium]
MEQSRVTSAGCTSGGINEGWNNPALRVAGCTSGRMHEWQDKRKMKYPQDVRLEPDKDIAGREKRCGRITGG